MKSFTIVLAIATLTIVCLNQAKADFLVTREEGEQTRPSIDGNSIVWVNEPYYGLVYFSGYTGVTRDSFSFDPGITEFYTPPMISGDIVVWSCDTDGDWNVYGYNISTSTQIPISTDKAHETGPSISGNIVVWTDYRNSEFGDIYGYNLATGRDFEICIDSAIQGFPSISGDIVVWQDYRNGNWDIYGYDLSTLTEFPICEDSADQQFPSVGENIVVWTDSRNYGSLDIYGYDLSTRTESSICTNNFDQHHPKVDGNVVVWQDDRGFSSPKVYGYDFITGNEFQIKSDFSEQRFPSISNGIVVYEVSGQFSTDIYGSSTNDDNCFNPTPVFKDIPYNGTTIGYTGSDISSCGYHDQADRWHRFNPDEPGDYKISLCGSNFDTTLAVFDNCGGTEITCNDDSCGKQSQVLLKARGGNSYFIRVSGYHSETGDYTLLITECSPLKSDLNGDCAVNLLDFTMMASEWLQEGTP